MLGFASTSIQHLLLMFRKWRNAILGTLLVLGGIGTAILTSLARNAGDWELTRMGAVASLVFVALITIFVVPPLMRSARSEVSRFDPPFQITAGGAIFTAIFLVVGFAAYNTGNNLLFLIFSVLVSTFFVAWTAARASLRDLSVSARFPDHIFAGESAPVIVTLNNTKRLLPSFSILIEARSRNEDVSQHRRRWATNRFAKRALAYFVYVPHRTRAQQRVEQTFQKRGHLIVTGFELSTRFPFGFFRLRRHLRARDVDLIVYPKVEPASDDLHLLPMNAGRHVSARRGAGHDLHSLRNYQTQDDVRHIDWKATARVGQLTVREFSAEDERRVHIVLETRLNEQGDSSKDFAERFERGVTLAASLVAHFIEERAEVRLTLGDEEGHYGATREHLYDCLRRLALIAPQIEEKRRDERDQGKDWEHLFTSTPSSHSNYVILLTAAAPGTIPAHVWRHSHVIYL